MFLVKSATPVCTAMYNRASIPIVCLVQEFFLVFRKLFLTGVVGSRWAEDPLLSEDLCVCAIPFQLPGAITSDMESGFHLLL